MKQLPGGNGNINFNKAGAMTFRLGMLILFLAAFFFIRSFECELEPELIATVKLDPVYFPDGNIYESWHAVYEAYDDHPGTWIHPHEYYQSRTKDEWPDMDLENYTYIITYCQKIQSLSYYVWRENNIPTYTGAKEAHMILEQTTEPLTIYIYRIPKMRINNPDI